MHLQNLWSLVFIFWWPTEFTNRWPSRRLTATKYSFSFISSDKFWTRLIIICQTCFHIMTQKMTGLVELNLQWELYFFTLLFSSTGLLWLLALWIWFNYFLFIPISSSIASSCPTKSCNPEPRSLKVFSSFLFFFLF